MRPIPAASVFLGLWAMLWACSEQNITIAATGETGEAGASQEAGGDGPPRVGLEDAAEVKAEAGPADGGSDSGKTDGGSDSSVDLFADAGTFEAGAAGPPATIAKSASAHNGDPSGKDCVVAGCHLDARPWAFGGTLYTDAAGTARVPNAELRVTRPDGSLLASTFSDVDGNFWIELADPTVPAGSLVGVRTASKQKIMTATIGGAQVGCQKAGCHSASAPAGRVFLD